MAEPQRKAALIEAGGGAQVAWLGSRVRYLAVGEQTAGRYAASVVVMRPGDSSPPQVRHRDHEGLFVLTGELSVQVGSRSLTLPAGGFVNVPPGAARRYANRGDVPAEVLGIAAPAGFDEFQFRAGWPLAKPAEPVPPTTAEDVESVAALAAGYGVEPNPPASQFEAEPALRVTLPGEGTRLAVVGDLYRFLAVSEDTESRYALWHATVSPGGGPPLHSHANEDEAFHVLSGTVTFAVDGTTRRLGPGGFAHLPSRLPHRFTNETAEPARMLILVAPGGLERMFESTGRVWHDADTLPGPPDAAELTRLAEAAPKFGIELFP